MIKLPAIALRGMTILPGMIAHFDISREKSLKAVEASMNENQQIFLVTQKDVEIDNPGLEELYQVGIIAEIKQVIKMQNNIVRVLAEGKCRAGIFSFTEKKEYLEADVEIIEDVSEELTQDEKNCYASKHPRKLQSVCKASWQNCARSSKAGQFLR